MLAPIILFVYNRPWHTQQTVNSLLMNKESSISDLYIFADGIRENSTEKQISNFLRTREYIHTISGFKNITIVEYDINKGLGRSIIDGVTNILKKYDSVIVLEDDIVVSPHFLRFMNESLVCYEDNEQVICINGYNLITNTTIKETSFFLRGGDCWGWATWKRAWKLFNPDASELLNYINEHKCLLKDFTFNGTMYYMDLLRAVVEGKNDSWAIRWYTSTFIKGGLCLYPTKSLCKNIGFGEGATNTISSDRDIIYTRVQANEEYLEYANIPIKECKRARYELTNIYRTLGYYPKLSLWKRTKQLLKQIVVKLR